MRFSGRKLLPERRSMVLSSYRMDSVVGAPMSAPLICMFCDVCMWFQVLTIFPNFHQIRP